MGQKHSADSGCTQGFCEQKHRFYCQCVDVDNQEEYVSRLIEDIQLSQVTATKTMKSSTKGHMQKGMLGIFWLQLS
ncbi:hypothetical protein DPMN_169709 [Dreissena polymorpha]|uniref:Uncharacterized protein n=1 Tax=Dreissena polymorpha TaxID=45954 RepID=A0A9D4DVR1_DREPO|nr:hypothetical protein DPMN_169709 [Dreissena polymorpha]